MKELFIYKIEEHSLQINCSELAEKNIKSNIVDFIGYSDTDVVEHFFDKEEAIENFEYFQSNYGSFHNSTDNENFWDISEYKLTENKYLVSDDFTTIGVFNIEDIQGFQYSKILALAPFKNNYEKITRNSDRISIEGMGNGWFVLDSTFIEKNNFSY